MPRAKKSQFLRIDPKDVLEPQSEELSWRAAKLVPVKPVKQKKSKPKH